MTERAKERDTKGKSRDGCWVSKVPEQVCYFTPRPLWFWRDEARLYSKDVRLYTNKTDDEHSLRGERDVATHDLHVREGESGTRFYTQGIKGGHLLCQILNHLA